MGGVGTGGGYAAGMAVWAARVRGMAIRSGEEAGVGLTGWAVGVSGMGGGRTEEFRLW
jgi:hypothetical protein